MSVLSLAVGVVVGAYVGWNFPQPELAKRLQVKAIELFLVAKAKVAELLHKEK